MAANKQRWLVLANVSMAVFMATLDGSIANVGLPTISVNLQVPLHVVQWVVTAYLLAISATLPIVGKIADSLGRARVFNFSFLVFALGSALCALSPNIGVLISMRVLQAIGAAMLMANTQAIVVTTFPPEERGRALGITGTMVSIGSLTGPALGGFLLALFGWPSIFWVNVPIGFAGFVVGRLTLPRDARSHLPKSFDYLGSLAFMLAMITLLFTVSNVSVWGWASPLSMGGFVIAAALSAMLFAWERRVETPMLDFSLYRIRAFGFGSLAAFLAFVSLYCTVVMMPFYMQNALGYSTAVTGLVMSAYPITMAITAPLAGYLSDRLGPYFLTTGGLLINAIGFGLLNMLTTAAPWVIAGHLAILGIGQGLFQPPNNSGVMSAAPRDKLGVAGGLNALVRNVGMVFGIALSMTIFLDRLRSMLGHSVPVGGVGVPLPDFLSALHMVFWFAAGACLAGMVASAVRGRPNSLAPDPAKA